MGHNTLGTHNRDIADSDAGEYRGVDANPHFILNHDGSSVGRAAVIGVDIVIDGYEVALRAGENAVADGDSAATEKCIILPGNRTG